jgi:hypothetical protein
MRRETIFLTLVVMLIAAAGLFLARDAIRSALFNVTGEENLLAQVRGLIDYATNVIRPMPDTAPDAVLDEAGVSPFGINTFLEQEVEPAKRDRQLQMIADAGYAWIRQQFPWYDIEIAGKGYFQDCRHANSGPCIDAWKKYDNIVDRAEQHGLNVIARLEAPPKWAQTASAILRRPPS